jgi:hypothetical protein
MRHVLEHGTCGRPPAGMSVSEWRRQLGRLCHAGVLRIWEWEVEGELFRPEPAKLASRYLYVAGPSWGKP